MYATVPTATPSAVISDSGGLVTLAGRVGLRRSGHGLGQAEVENLRSALGEEDVRGLDVAVEDALGVGGVEGINECERDVDDGRDIQRSARQPLLERLALEQLHRDERWLCADVVNRADIRMIQRRGRAALALEPLDGLGIGLESIGQCLDCDDAVEPCVLGSIDLAHPARSERGHHRIRAKPSTRLQHHLTIRDYRWATPLAEPCTAASAPHATRCAGHRCL